jgi:hypothetical protein
MVKARNSRKPASKCSMVFSLSPRSQKALLAAAHSGARRSIWRLALEQLDHLSHLAWRVLDVEGCRPGYFSSVSTGETIVPAQRSTPLEVLASVTGSGEIGWEGLDGSDGGVGVDFWYRHRGSGSEAYLNLDRVRPTISGDDKKVCDSPRERSAWD